MKSLPRLEWVCRMITASSLRGSGFKPSDKSAAILAGNCMVTHMISISLQNRLKVDPVDSLLLRRTVQQVIKVPNYLKYTVSALVVIGCGLYLSIDSCCVPTLLYLQLGASHFDQLTIMARYVCDMTPTPPTTQTSSV